MIATQIPQIPEKLYFRIGDVAELVGVKPYVLRYWETEFPFVSPQKSTTGQRVYRRSDVENLLLIKHLLYQERYSIDGARNRIRELRKEGGLKNYRAETVAPKLSPEKQKRARGLARELKSLIDAPVRQIFRY